MTNLRDYDRDATLIEKVRDLERQLADAQAMIEQLQVELGTLKGVLDYPDCWDTAAYPTIESALHEIAACYRCTGCTTPPSVPEGWQPIETAPKDGTEILVWFDCATVPVVHIAWYRSKKEWEDSGKYCGGWDSLEDWGGWWSYTTGSVSQYKLDGYRTPTHWMPLPEAPKPGDE